MPGMSCHMPCIQRLGRPSFGLSRSSMKRAFKCARPVRDLRVNALKTQQAELSSPARLVTAVLGLAAAFMTGDVHAEEILVATNAPTMSVMDLYYGAASETPSKITDTPAAAPTPKAGPVKQVAIVAPAAAATTGAAAAGTLNPAFAAAAVAIGVGSALAVRGGKKEKEEVETAAPKAGTQKVAVRGGTAKIAAKSAKAGTSKIAVAKAGTLKLAVAKAGTSKIAVAQKQGTSKVAAQKAVPVKGGTSKVSASTTMKVKVTKQAPPPKGSKAAAPEPEAAAKGSDSTTTVALVAVFGLTLAVCGALLTGSSAPTKTTKAPAKPVRLEELVDTPSSKAPAKVAAIPTPAAPAPAAPIAVPAPKPAAPVIAAVPAPAPAPVVVAPKPIVPPVPAPKPAESAPVVASKPAPAVEAPKPAPAVAVAPAPAAPAPKPVVVAPPPPPAPVVAAAPAPAAPAPVAEKAEAVAEEAKPPATTLFAVITAIASAIGIAYVYQNKKEELFKPPTTKDKAPFTLLRTPRPRDVPVPSGTASVAPPAPGATSNDAAREVALSEVYARLLENETFQTMLSASLASAGVPFNPAELKNTLLNDSQFKSKLQAVADALPEEKQAALKELQSDEKIAELEKILSAALTPSK